ncbi:MAG TPA: universal stress protein [Ktedonobacteraceae bacterium]|jgi:hypothetical protein|nr:universal stress protein [Ktedonobacteraceae bacterium]
MVLMVRLLLPFTHGIDSPAITSALALARQMNATLILLSLIPDQQAPGKGPRWEDIQQSRDFLEFTQHKAARLDVPVERVELFTRNAPRSIRTFAWEMDCAGIVLAMRGERGILLDTREIQQLLGEKNPPIYMVSFLAKKRLFSWPGWFSRQRDKATEPPASSVLHWKVFAAQSAYQSHGPHVLTDS